MENGKNNKIKFRDPKIEKGKFVYWTLDFVFTIGYRKRIIVFITIKPLKLLDIQNAHT